MFRISLVSLMMIALDVGAEPGPAPREIRTDLYGDRLPEGAIARLGTARWRLDGLVRFLAFGPDGKTILSCTKRELIVWDRETGLAKWRLSTGADVSSLVLSGDQRILIGTGKTQIRRWDLANGRELPAIKEEEKRYAVAALSADGSLVAAGEDGRSEIDVWETATGKRLHRFSPGENFALRLLALSPDGRRLAYAGNDDHITLLDLATGREGLRLRKPGALMGLTFSPDGKMVAVIGLDQIVCLWDAGTGELRHQCNANFPESNFRNVIAFAADGKTAVQTSINGIALWDTATGRKLQTHPATDHLTAVALSPDGKTIAIGGREQNIRLMDAATGKILNPTAGHNAPVCAIAFSPDGRTLASAGEDRTIRMWDTRTSRELFQVSGHDSGATRLFFTPDGRFLISTDKNATIRWSEAATGLPLPRRSVMSISHPLALSPDGTILACNDGGRIQLRDGATGADRGPLGILGHEVNSLSFAAGRRIVAATEGGEPGIQLWDVQTRALWRTLPGGQHRSVQPHLMAVTPDGRMIAMQQAGGHIDFWETAGAGNRRTISTGLPQITELAFSPDGQMLAVAENGGLIQFHDMTEARKSGSLLVGPLNAEARPTMAFSPDSRTLAVVGRDTTITLWAVSVLPPLERKASILPKGLWDDLAGDSVTAYHAIRILTNNPTDAVSFLKDRMRPAPPTDPMAIARWVTELDNNRFAVRERAGVELAKLRHLALPALQAGLKAKPGAEAQGRIEKLLAAVKIRRPDLAGDELREVRAVEALEAVATPEAKRLLESLAKGAPEARLTEEAKESLSRLNRNTNRQ
ncbi:WD40 repeat domain-containing protein [Zavarzinella formosa]|uniref:WD40 repeat domain-containing protein n=1 Tax=Zavarzinella formosa TaxID=360055 RepID=UPI00030E1755|nr:WD40 repeat domain-containing protein [Zavarzinella formosa]